MVFGSTDSLTFIAKKQGCGSRHFNADPDSAFCFNADPDPAFHFIIRIRIQLFTLMRIRIQFFTLMRIRRDPQPCRKEYLFERFEVVHGEET
jgi:hypothetical protein